MVLFCPSEAQDLMKIYNGQQTRHTNKFVMAVQKKVAAFVYWVCDLQRRQEPIIYTLWTHSQLVLSIQELEVEVSCAKYDPVEIKVVNIDVGLVLDDCKEIFVTKMGIRAGVDGLHRKYIICKINPQGWVAACNAKTDEERLIYSVLLHGPGYDTDNHSVWQEIQNCCIGTISYKFMREFDANKYVRSVWLALLRPYEGTNSENKRIVLANQDI